MLSTVLDRPPSSLSTTLQHRHSPSLLSTGPSAYHSVPHCIGRLLHQSGIEPTPASSSVLTGLQLSKQQVDVTLKINVANVCFKCFIYFRDMLQVFHMNVAKLDQDVPYAAMVVHVCCKRLFPMFHLFFRRMLQVFYLDVAYVSHIYCKRGGVDPTRGQVRHKCHVESGGTRSSGLGSGPGATTAEKISKFPEQEISCVCFHITQWLQETNWLLALSRRSSAGLLAPLGPLPCVWRGRKVLFNGVWVPHVNLSLYGF
jgi:hypothetical protein